MEGHAVTVNKYDYTVTVYAESQDNADQVMAERLDYDEEYGFKYEVDYYALFPRTLYQTVTLRVPYVEDVDAPPAGWDWTLVLDTPEPVEVISEGENVPSVTLYFNGATFEFRSGSWVKVASS